MKSTQQKTYYLKIYGCLFNHADANRIRTILNQAGYKEVTDESKADHVIAITCSVREKAEHKVAGYINNLKKTNPNVHITITGCMVRRDFLDDQFDRTRRRLSALRRRLQNADAFIDITNITKLPDVLEGKTPYTQLVLNRDKNRSYIDLPPTLPQKDITSAIPIMTGCNQMCTYCIVPFTRGQEQYRDFYQVLEEVETSLKQGRKIIQLLGQIVDKWHDSKNNKTFLDLLKAITQLPYDFYLFFTSPHPNYITKEILQFMDQNPKMLKYLGLPLQSGSNKVLKAMNRKYTREKYIKVAQMARNTVKDLFLTTDIIVGFPPEDEHDFEQTLDIVQKLRFDKVFFAKYSPRLNNSHQKLAHDPEYQRIVSRKSDRLNKLAQRIFAENNQKQIGKVYPAIITNPTQALTIRNQIVDIPKTNIKPGTFVKVKITGGGRRGVMGEILEH